MRIAILVLFFALAQPAWAAEIVGSMAMGCSDSAVYGRANAAYRGGDKGGAAAIISRALSTGVCTRLSEGLKVRIEPGEPGQGAYGLRCVAPFGTAEACRWIMANEVKP